MYNKTEWKDHIVEYPERFIISTNQDETSTITKAQGQIMQDGTPVNAKNLNKIEQGIFENAEAIIENKNEIATNTQAIAINTQAIEKTMQAMSNITNRRWVCNIGVNGWIENNGVWTQEVNCEGLTADIVLLGDIYSIQTDNIDELVSTFDNYKRAYRIESMNGKIRIYASLKPMKAFQMQFIEVARVK